MTNTTGRKDTEAAMEDRMTPDTWRAEGEVLAAQHKAHQWAIADWLLRGMQSMSPEEVYTVGEKLFPQYTRTTFKNWVYVARAFPPSIRIDALTFGHHQAVMGVGKLPDELPESNERTAPEWVVDLRQDWLSKAFFNNWSVARLRAEVAHELELWAWAKEEEKAREEAVPDAPVEETGHKPAPPPGFSLADLSFEYRRKLAYLARARQMPEHILAKALLEQALIDAEDEIAGQEQVEADKNKAALEKAVFAKAESTRKRAEQVADEIGWDPDLVLIEAAEYDSDPETELAKKCRNRWAYARLKFAMLTGQEIPQLEYAAWAANENASRTANPETYEERETLSELGVC